MRDTAVLKTCTCRKAASSSARDVMSEGRVGAGTGDSSWVSGGSERPIRQSHNGSRSYPSLCAWAPAKVGTLAPGTSCERM